MNNFCSIESDAQKTSYSTKTVNLCTSFYMNKSFSTRYVKKITRTKLFFFSFSLL